MQQAEKERIAKLGKKWTPKGYITKEIEAIRRQVGDKKGKSVKKWNTAGKTVLTNTDDRSGGGWADTTRE